jgi:carboxynorspermidine decarboxylase
LARANGKRRCARDPAFAVNVETPAFVIDEHVIHGLLGEVDRLRAACGCRVLYALKPLAFEFVLEMMKPHVDGFATSSLFEARLARAVLDDAGSVHLTTPGLRAHEIPELARLCDFVAFNSLGQCHHLAGALDSPEKAGLRLNPELPLVSDDRYNPCRRHSKLGVPLGQFRRALRRRPAIVDEISGLHFHTNCDSARFEPLFETVEHIESHLRDLLPRLSWINLGGGYLLDPAHDYQPLADAVQLLQSRYGLDVFFEPGAALVRSAGFLVAEVIDLFPSGGKTVAVLDTTVNHLPEVFEYQFEPDLLGHDDLGDHEYRLVGSSCLAGDLFGDYGFAAPLRLGSRVVFNNVGAYSIVKAHMFNGINLPTIYSVTREGELVLRRRFTYQDFLSRCGAPSDAFV